MSFSAWARRVLTADSLAEKLVAAYEGDESGPIPDLPGRPPELALPPRGASIRAPFPAAHTLGDPEARGRALHFFANHELLALELMALLLVRHPELPVAFQRGLVGIIGDEQRHLRGYLARMADTGVRFGDLPVNRYFWDALAAAEPLSVLAGLSLTFEQANLDFAAAYAEAFRRVGDDATAATLDEVLRDEERHVAHGLWWFDAWRPPGPRWEAWVAALPEPLTPARAKGPRVYVEPRRRAGLTDEEILRLTGFGASKGRPPDVWTFHPDLEAEIAGASPSPVGARVTRDLAPLLLFLAGADDVVVAPEVPSPTFLAGLASLGFTLPEIVPDVAALAGRRLGTLRPWGWSPEVARQLAPLGAPPWDPARRALSEKSWAVERLRERPDLCDPAVVGTVCRSWEEVCAVAPGPTVVKAPLGTAGRGMRRWEPGIEPWVRAILEEQGAVVVEPWLDRVLDLSLQFDVDGDRARSGPWGRFLTDDRGAWRGAVLGDSLADQPAAIRRLLAKRGGDLAAIAQHLAPAMAALGFRGPAGIDALVYRVGDRLALKPLVELNPRLTMGRVALALDRRVRRDRVARWRVIQIGRAHV